LNLAFGYIVPVIDMVFYDQHVPQIPFALRIDFSARLGAPARPCESQTTNPSKAKKPSGLRL
jgi:hypothetical protein